MAKALDLSKFRKDITKALPNISPGFSDPKIWISTSNYALNFLLSSDFNKGIPLGKVTVLAGRSGSGKSFLASGNIVREAQKKGIFVFLIDTENALDDAWLRALNVDTSEDKLYRVPLAMIDDVAKFIAETVAWYRGQIDGVPDDERMKIMFVIDSLGMLLTPTDVNQFEAGDLKGDMGRKPRALNALVRNCVNMFGALDIGLVATNHSYSSQDMFDPDDKITGGQGFIYASSMVVAMDKRKLKEDEDGNKTSEVHGIRSAIKVMKSRYAKPFESIEVRIPWSTGMDPYSGLIDLFEKKGALAKDGNKLKYVALDGTEHKYFRKAIPNELLDRIMAEWNQKNMDTTPEGVGLELEGLPEEENEQ